MSFTQSAIKAASDTICNFLKPYGLTVTCETESIDNGVLGEYESGSVFSYDIICRIDLDNLKKCCKEERCSLAEQIKLTIYHETGHALMEQLIDYAENLPEMDTLLRGHFGQKYFDVFNDDHLDEETIVEDFAHGFLYNHGSLLQSCFEEFHHSIS